MIDILSEFAVNARAISSAALTAAARDFHERGIAKVPFLVSRAVQQAVADEVLELAEAYGVRREVRFSETDNSLRQMRNVRRDEIFGRAVAIPRVYRAEALCDMMSTVAAERVHVCPYEPEQCLITRLERSGDTHGWHWDDFSFALVWVVECPPAEDGGFVQCVPRTVWDKHDPSVSRALVTGPTYSIELLPGDLYLMRTDTTMHRVYPLRAGRRTILNMGFASTEDLKRSVTHETMDALWATTTPPPR
ncbi:MAG: HalD/BesD family halogenase [Acidimicrobiales bacterium]